MGGSSGIAILDDINPFHAGAVGNTIERNKEPLMGAAAIAAIIATDGAASGAVAGGEGAAVAGAAGVAETAAVASDAAIAADAGSAVAAGSSAGAPMLGVDYAAELSPSGGALIGESAPGVASSSSGVLGTNYAAELASPNPTISFSDTVGHAAAEANAAPWWQEGATGALKAVGTGVGAAFGASLLGKKDPGAKVGGSGPSELPANNNGHVVSGTSPGVLPGKPINPLLVLGAVAGVYFLKKK